MENSEITNTNTNTPEQNKKCEQFIPNFNRTVCFILFLEIVWCINISITGINQKDEEITNMMSFVCISGLLLYFLGNYYNIFLTIKQYLCFGIIMSLSCFIFRKIGEIHWMKHSLVSHENWEYNTFLVYISVLVVIILILLKLITLVPLILNLCLKDHR